MADDNPYRSPESAPEGRAASPARKAPRRLEAIVLALIGYSLIDVAAVPYAMTIRIASAAAGAAAIFYAVWLFFRPGPRKTKGDPDTTAD
ncbi:hypothetical protein Pla123a_06110 [Posidoniimonas polymericola]|uniref:Uncharacterized protein n=1 Tax=Posidoniimonas polymericola TaxID=2528002 RepID=A0A5C5ZEL2_9BACT|nr:hypothetical protein [Posidoniimonas polymericola]TWT85804.1 hypothetical protein Pla123a_06110 [Posidoniimonas polymericola]